MDWSGGKNKPTFKHSGNKLGKPLSYNYVTAL